VGEELGLQFSVGDGGQEDFQLWVPTHWTAFVLRVHHYMLCYQLVDTIPPPPMENRMEGQERRVESIHKSLQIQQYALIWHASIVMIEVHMHRFFE
jgi:hypothetical protein